MIIKFVKWIIAPSKKPIIENTDLYAKIVELEEKYQSLLLDIKNLEEENIETSNCLYELSNQIDAVDARIDILAVEPYTINQFNLGNK
jgi:septal ring factor EnvC (AmiA/AmiB activator)